MDRRMNLALGLAAAAGLTLLTGCSVINSIKGNGKKSGSDVSQETVLPHDRENIAAKTELRKYTPEEIARGVVKGDWAIETVYGKDAVGEKAPFLKFVPSQNTVYGNNGCNSLHGGYIYNPKDSTIRFSDMATTMMMCAKEGITEYEINQALDAVRYYSWKEKDSNYYLTLLDSSRQPVMTLMHQNFQFLNGTWRVTGLNGNPIDNPDMQLVIDVDEGKIHGNTGCNILNGAMETDMDTANSISFNAIATTRMACPPPNHETEMIVALEEAVSARPVSPTEVIFLNNQGKTVMKLTRVS